MTLLAWLRTRFVNGIILLLPLAVTVFVLNLVFNWTLVVVDPVVEGTRLVTYTSNNQLLAQVIAAVSVVVGVTVLGAVAESRSGRRLSGGFGRVLSYVPVVRTLYFSLRQVMNAVSGGSTQFKRTVVLEYPREDVYSLGFVTGTQSDVAGEGEMMSVYLPNSPNPTGGRLVFVPQSAVHETDLSVSQGLRLILTTGIEAEERGEDLPVDWPIDGTM